MYTLDNIKFLNIYFKEINYSERINISKDDKASESDDVGFSFSIDRLNSEIGQRIKNNKVSSIIKNDGSLQIDSNIFILKVRFIAFFDVIGIENLNRDRILSEQGNFDNLILISIEEMRKILNTKLSNLLKFTQFSPEDEVIFWQEGQVENPKG